jgi:hypothetical protein
MDPNMAQGLAVMGAIAPGVPNLTPAQQALYQGAGVAGQMSYNRNTAVTAAQAGASQVTVNAGGGAPLPGAVPGLAIAAPANQYDAQWDAYGGVAVCCGWSDANGDGRPAISEMVGIKAAFGRGQTPHIIIRVLNAQGQQLAGQCTYTPKMSSALSQALIGGTKTVNANIATIGSNDFFWDLGHDIGPGQFNWTFYAGGRVIGSTQYTVSN